MIVIDGDPLTDMTTMHNVVHVCDSSLRSA